MGGISYTWRGKLKLFAVISILCLFCVLSPALFAQDDTLTEEAPVEDRITAAERALPLGDAAAETALAPSPVSALSILRVLLTLAVVAAAIYGLVYLFKRLARGGMSRDPFLKILASAPLGTNRSAYIISVGSQAWLVGVAESGVNLISEIGDKDAINAMLLEDSRRTAEASEGGLAALGAAGSGNFKALLRRLGMPVDSAPPGPDSIRKRGERLKGL